MPKINNEIPEALRPYKSLGIELSWRRGETHAYGDCPLCDRGERFAVKIETGQFRCLKCEERGNIYAILNWLVDEGIKQTSDQQYRELARERNLLSIETLKAWGVCLSLLTRQWLVPGFGAKSTVTNLYRRVLMEKDGQPKWRLVATAGLHKAIHGMRLFDPTKQIIYLCEGPWDGMMLWETLSRAMSTRKGLIDTRHSEHSLLSEACVLALPSCNVFADSWTPLFAGKRVVILFDNDHPRIHAKTGKKIEPAALAGTERVASTLLASETPPQEVVYLKWGETGYNTELPSGYDIGDFICA